MGTGIDHLTEQKAGRVSEISCYSTLYCQCLISLSCGPQISFVLPVTIFGLWPLLTIRAINQMSLDSEIDWWACGMVHILEIISSWEQYSCHNGTLRHISAVYSLLVYQSVLWSNQPFGFWLFHLYPQLHNLTKPCLFRTFDLSLFLKNTPQSLK